MTEDSATQASPVRKFLKDWGLLVGFGVFVVCAFVGFRYWTEFQADQPVRPQYRGFLDHLSENSASARAYEHAYRQKFERTSVASRHFEQVCAVMARLAEADGVNTDAYSTDIGYGCRRLARHYTSDDLPE